MLLVTFLKFDVVQKLDWVKNRVFVIDAGLGSNTGVVRVFHQKCGVLLLTKLGLNWGFVTKKVGKGGFLTQKR